MGQQLAKKCPLTANTFAGDLSPFNSWEVLKLESQSNLIDVHTDAEYLFVEFLIFRAWEKIFYVIWLFI